MAKVLVLARDAPALVARLARAIPGLDIAGTTQAAEALALAADRDVLMTRNDDAFESVIAAMPRLAWVQALTTGTDLIESCAALPSGVTITAARGFHGPQMSELAFLFMLALARNFPAMLANQRERRWHRAPQKLLLDKTVVILGVGRIAEELAQRCKVFGMKVIGVSAARTTAPGFDAIMARDKLAEAAALADDLIVLAPASAETHHLVDVRALAAMKPSAVLINLARGDVVDEAALIEALRTRRIAGAGLDVFLTEPLPADNPLWSLDNVLLTPHVGGMSDIYVDQVIPLVIDNLRAFLDGAPERLCYVVRS